jgi:very-short-patch-repair endonuclease
MKGRRLHNLRRFKEYRHKLRRNLTPAEARLWTCLKGSQLEGKKFRRQHGIGPYIVDFYCPEYRVIVELDGAVHEDVLRAERDERRLYLENLGIKILRFENKLVFEDIELVLNAIRAGLGAKLPASAEAGWLRAQEKVAKPP